MATVLVGAFGLRVSRTTSDFYVASRTVGPRLNAAAISGEYLSAASFLGIAGLVLVQGPDMLWYPVGYTAGYVVLLLFVAAPLRRSGAYTLPDFAEARLASQAVRRLAGAFVVGVGWLYLLPQLQGAGLTLTVLTGAPDWLGGIIVAVVVAAIVAAGGMRSITFVQAFQYWLKLTALLVPAFFLLLAWQADGAPRRPFDEPPGFREQRAVRVDTTLDLRLERPLTVTVDGTVDGRAARRHPSSACRPAPTASTPGTRLSFARHPRPGGRRTAAADAGLSTVAAPRAATERPLYAACRADPRHVPRHHGPAARGGPVLHQPARRRRPPHHRRRPRPDRRLLPAAAGLRRARPALRARTHPHRRRGRRRAAAARTG
ncbi:Cation/acetate symporter ActP [Streptomyces glaucescens]